MEQRLQRIFTQQYQIKRVMKQVQQLKDAKSKLGLELRYLSRQNIQFVIIVQIVRERLLEIKKLSFLDKIQFKVVLSQDYPGKPPLIYFTNQNAIEIGLNPFHDYLKCICPSWNPKVSTLDIVKSTPAFVVQNLQKTKQFIGEPALYEYFQVERLFSYMDCQVFPVKLIKNNENFNGMICIVNGEEVVLLQQSINFTSSYNNTDFIKIQEIFSVQKHKSKPLRAMLQIKRLNKRYAVQFSSEQCQAVIESIVEKMKALQVFDKQTSQDSNDDSDNELQTQVKKNSQLQIDQSNVSFVESEILILQSLVDTNPTSSTINELISLLQKVVEFYSMKGSSRCEVHLKNLQNLMNSEFTQVLIESSEETVKAKHEKREYESITNYF